MSALLRFCMGMMLMVAMAGCEAARSSRSEPESRVGPSQPDQVPEEHLLGLKVYKAKCNLCHDRGDEGAPRIGNPRQWANRVKQTGAILVQHALEGFEGMRGEMPPQGENFSETEIAAAVAYMMFRYEAAAKTE